MAHRMIRAIVNIFNILADNNFLKYVNIYLKIFKLSPLELTSISLFNKASSLVIDFTFPVPRLELTACNYRKVRVKL